MRSLRAWLVYLAAVFLGGALLAPWLHQAVVSLAEHHPAWQSLAANPFHRFVNRALLLLAVIGLWPLLRHLGVRSWSAVGWCRPSGQVGRLGLGLVLGFGSLAIVAALALSFGARAWREALAPAEVLERMAGAALTAVVVATLEETLFRGALHGTLQRDLGRPAALVFSSLIYAWVHFFARVRWEGPIEWHTGLVVLGQMLRGFVEPASLVPAFLNLALAGALLGLAFERTRSLYLSVGLHAGWIFWLKFYGATTAEVAGKPAWFWGTGKLIDGWVALLVLAAVLPLLSWWAPRSKIPAPPGASSP